MKTAEDYANESPLFDHFDENDIFEVAEMMRQYADQSRPNWISVEDELPMRGEEVLVYWESKQSIHSAFFANSGNDVFDIDGFSFYHAPIYHITHWMALPEKP